MLLLQQISKLQDSMREGLKQLESMGIVVMFQVEEYNIDMNL